MPLIPFIKEHWIVIVIIAVVVISITVYLIYRHHQNNKLQDPNTLNASESIKSYAKSKEGLELTAYYDQELPNSPNRYAGGKGKLTIGYGHTGPDVYEGMVIDENDANALFEVDSTGVDQNLKGVIKVPVTQNNYDGLWDFAYNTGAYGSSVFTMVNNGDLAGASEFLKNHYIEAGGVVLPGLVSRRGYEAGLEA